MLKNIKLATKDTFIYSLGNISTKIIGLILLPLYTEKLPVADYGILGTVEITIQILIAAFSLSLSQGLNRWYWDKKYRNKQKSIFFTTQATLFLGSLVMLLLLLPFTDTFSQALLYSKEYTYIITLLLISAALQIQARNVLSLMRLQRKPLLFSVTNIIKLLITLGLTIYFIVGLKRGIEGILEAQIIGFILFIMINIKFIINNSTPVFERSILKEMIVFSYPLAISAVSGTLLTVTDRYAVTHIKGLSEMGLYTLAFKIANALKIFIINSLASALMPLKFQMMDKPDSKRFYSKIMTYTAFGFILLLLILSLFSQEVIKVVAQKSAYWSAYQLVPILCFAQLFELLRRNANFGLIIEKKTKIISSLMIFVSILNIGINILLVSYFGTFGGATATLLTQILFFIFIYHFAQKHYPISYEIKKIMLMTLLAGAIVIVSFLFVNSMELFPRLMIKLLLIIIFPLLLYFLRFYDPIEIERLKGAWNKWKNPKHWKNNLSQIKIK